MRTNAVILQRKSNFELLRIACMLAIILSHFIGRSPIGNHQILCKLLECFLAPHVTLFLLISGYFGIKLRWKSVVKIGMPCVFYSLAIFALGVYFNLYKFSLLNLGLRFTFFIRPTPWWFVENYFYLMLFSPIINKLIESVSHIQYVKILCLLLFIDCIVGGLMKSSIDKTGFNYIHFIVIYMIGRYIRLYICQNPKIKIDRKKCVVLYILSSLCVFIISAIGPVVIWLWDGEVNPFVIISAVSIFLLFTTFNFQSKALNYIASSAFATYLIHDEETISEPLYIKGLAFVFKYVGNIFVYTSIIILIAFLVYVFCTIIDKICNAIIIRPFTNFFVRYDPIAYVSVKLNNFCNKYVN